MTVSPEPSSPSYVSGLRPDEFPPIDTVVFITSYQEAAVVLRDLRLVPVRLVLVYTCPIHAIIEQPKPGKCRICWKRSKSGRR